MTGKKVKLAFIVDDDSRKATYIRRQKGLLKKVYELSTLCGVEACAVVYGPYEPQPEIWPSPEGVQMVLSKFKTMTVRERSNKTVDQETYMKERVLKAKEKLKIRRHDNKEKEMTMLMNQCLFQSEFMHNNMSLVDSKHLCWLIDHKLKEVGKRLEAEDNSGQHQIQIQMPPPFTFSNEEMTRMGPGHARLPMNNGDNIESQSFMGLMMNSYGDESVPFGEVDPRVLPNLLP